MDISSRDKFMATFRKAIGLSWCKSLSEKGFKDLQARLDRKDVQFEEAITLLQTQKILPPEFVKSFRKGHAGDWPENRTETGQSPTTETVLPLNDGDTQDDANASPKTSQKPAESQPDSIQTDCDRRADHDGPELTRQFAPAANLVAIEQLQAQVATLQRHVQKLLDRDDQRRQELKGYVDTLATNATAAAVQRNTSLVSKAFKQEMITALGSYLNALTTVNTQIEGSVSSATNAIAKLKTADAEAERRLTSQLAKFQQDLLAKLATNVAADKQAIALLQASLTKHVKEQLEAEKAERETTWNSLQEKTTLLLGVLENFQVGVAELPAKLAHAFEASERHFVETFHPTASTALEGISQELAKAAATGAIKEFAVQAGASQKTLAAIQAQADELQKQNVALANLLDDTRESLLQHVGDEFDRMLGALRESGDGRMSLDVVIDSLRALRDETMFITRGADMIEKLDVVGSLPRLFNELEELLNDWDGVVSGKGGDSKHRTTAELLQSLRLLITNWQELHNIIRLGNKGEDFVVTEHELSRTRKTNDPQLVNKIAEVVRLGYALRRRNEKPVVLQKPKVVHWVK